MNILIMTIPVSILLASFFVLMFISAVSKGQFDDLESPAHTMLLENEENENDKNIKNNKGRTENV